MFENLLKSLSTSLVLASDVMVAITPFVQSWNAVVWIMNNSL